MAYGGPGLRGAQQPTNHALMLDPYFVLDPKLQGNAVTREYGRVLVCSPAH